MSCIKVSKQHNFYWVQWKADMFTSYVKKNVLNVHSWLITTNSHHAQGSKLKKSSGRLLATNWRNIVARCKFLVASLYNVNDAAHSQGLWHFVQSWRREIHKAHKIPQNSVDILSNTCLYNIFETFLSYWGYLLVVSLSIYLETLSLKRANNIPKLPGVDYVAKNWVLAMILKALPLVQFWNVLLLREQNNDDLC